MAFFVLAICLLLETLEQTVFTLSGRQAGRWMFWIGAGIGFHLVATLCWFWLLTLMPLGVAMPMMGGCYVTVCLVSWLFFKERVTRLHWAGVAAIVFGLAIIGLNGVDI